MTGRRAVFGLCLLCALAFSALAAQSAGATTKGTTGFTCVKKKEAGGAGFSREHCAPGDAVASGATYEHVGVAESTTTEVKGSNSKTASETTAATPITLKFTIAGTAIELQAATLEGAGWTENRRTAGGEHYVFDEGTTVFSGVTVTKPAGKGCKVFTDNEGAEGAEGVIDTANLKVTTEGQGDFFKFEPASGSTFASFFLTCNKGEVPEACEGTTLVTGSMKAAGDGATVIFDETEMTAQNTLKAKGAKAALGGKVTVSAKHPALDSTFSPLSVTTVETP